LSKVCHIIRTNATGQDLRISNPFKLAAKNMGRPVAFVSFKKAVMGAYAPIDDPTERVYVEYAAALSKRMGIPVPPGVVSWHLSGHKRWRRLVTLAKNAIERHGEAVFQAAAAALYNGDPKPMLDLLYPKALAPVRGASGDRRQGSREG